MKATRATATNIKPHAVSITLCRSTMREITKVVSETNAIAAAVRGNVSQNWSLAKALIGPRAEPAGASFDGNRARSAQLDWGTNEEGAPAREGCAARPFVRTLLHDGVAHAIALCVSSLRRIQLRVISSAALSRGLPVV